MEVRDGEGMGKQKKYHWDKENIEHMRQRWVHLNKTGKPVAWKNFEAFLRWCQATYEPGCSLQMVDKELPYGPDNCIWKPMNNSPAYQEELANQWDSFVVPIRERYARELREAQSKKRQFWKYEHPDLVREGIVFVGGN